MTYEKSSRDKESIELAVKWPEPYDKITNLPPEDRGQWLATASGKIWSIKYPHHREVDLDDVVWGIARQCRYAGQIRSSFEIYSVAEHCTTMAWWALDNDYVEYLEDIMVLLLHDASEGFYGDMPAPMKDIMPEFQEMENMAQAVMYHGFGLTPENTLISEEKFKHLDVRIRSDERMVLIDEPAFTIGLKDNCSEPLGVPINGSSPSQARLEFLQCFAYCVDHLPARDPNVKSILENHLEKVRDEIKTDNPRPSWHHVNRSESEPFRIGGKKESDLCMAECQ